MASCTPPHCSCKAGYIPDGASSPSSVDDDEVCARLDDDGVTVSYIT
jgi:hypothetical protein